jgi:hypothetical protein
MTTVGTIPCASDRATMAKAGVASVPSRDAYAPRVSREAATQ